MTEFAKLVMTAETDSLRRGEEALDRFTRKGAYAEDAIHKSMRKVSGSFLNVSDGALAMASSAGAAIGALAGAALSAQGILSVISKSRQFEAALAETSTLIQGTDAELNKLEADARKLAKTFGTEATSQMKAFYEALSGGASSVQEASILVEQANKLAVGGVTSTQTAVDVLTTSVNAYGKEVLSFSDASDSMFIGVLAGKMTMDQLAGSLGNVIPTAAATGVSFDELNAALAALTTQGLSVSTAANSLRAILSSVLAPSEQAKQAAKELGLEFNAQALQAKGLAGFLNDVIDKSDGNKEAMAKLFGSVEALGAVFAFAGGAGGKFSEILTQMENKAGATDAAAAKMLDTFDNRFKRAMSSLDDVGLVVGNALLTVVVPALEALASIFTFASDNAELLGAAISALAVSYIPSMVLAVSGAVAWLGTMEGLFIAGAIASRAMNVAIALTPLGLIMAAGAGLYALVSASNNATSAAAIHERAQTKLAEALERVNVGGLEGIRIKKQIAEAEVREALAATVRAEARLKEAEALAKRTEAGRAMLPVQLAATNAEKALFGAKENLQTMVEGARALGVNLSFLPAYLDPISAAAKETAGSLAEQLGYTQNMRAIYDADLVTAQGILAAQQERAKVAALTLQYGADSAQVAQAHHDAEMKVLEAQVAQLGVTGQVKDAIIQQANAAWQLENAMVGATDAAGRLRGVASLIAGALSPAVSAAWQLVRALGAAIASLGGVASGLARVAGLSGTVGLISGTVAKGFSAASSALSPLTSKLSGMHGEIVDVISAGGKLSDKLKALSGPELAKALADAKKEGKSLSEVLAGSGGGVSGAAGKAKTALTEAEEAAKKYADTMKGYVTDGIGKAVDWMVGGFKGGLRGLVDVFKSTIQQMIAYAIKNKIMVSMGLGGSVAGSAVAAAQASTGGASGLAGATGILGKAGGILSAFTGGISNVWAGLTTGGISGAFSAVGTALSGATTGLAGLAGAAGALVLPLGIVAGLFSFFKKKTELLDSGLKVTVNGIDALVQTFATVKTTRFWGLSKNTNTEIENASKEISDPITAAFKSIRKTVIGLAGDLGLGADRLDKFKMALSVSTKGMTQEEAQTAVVKELAKLGDGMAKAMLGGFNSLAKSGEGALDTLTRLSSNLVAANDAMKALGWSAYRVKASGIGAASAMVELYGGLDKFKAATDFYFQNFYTLAERTRYTGKQFKEALGDLGIKTVPKSIEQFRALMDRLRAAGRDNAVAGLMQLAPLFMSLQDLRGQLTSVGDDSSEAANRLQERQGLERRLLELQGKAGALRKLELQALDPANRALQKQIWALEKLKAVADERTALEKQLLQAQGNTAALRKLELSQLDVSNQALQQQVWAVEKANEVSTQRFDLERRLLELQGNTAELRNRELAALDPTNRALQKMIWGLEDAKEAISSLNQEDFASLFDFNLAEAKLKNRSQALPVPLDSGYSSSSAFTQVSSVPSNSFVSFSSSELAEIKQLLISISSNTRFSKDTARKWDVDGLPPERV